MNNVLPTIQMIQEEFVTLETAKLLKEKGFGDNSNKYVEKIQGTEREEWNEEECAYCTVSNVNIYPKPTQSIAQRWLREEHNIEVSVAYCRNSQFEHGASWYYWEGLISCADEEVKFGFDFKSYEEALEAGIQEALKLI